MRPINRCRIFQVACNTLLTVLLASTAQAQPDMFPIRSWLDARHLLDTVSGCPDLGYVTAPYREMLPNYQSGALSLPPYVLDSFVCGGRNVFLEVVSRFSVSGEHLPYLRVAGECSPYWIGPIEEPSAYFATTVRSRFLCFGGVEPTTESSVDQVIRILDEDGRGRTIGDTIFVHLTRFSRVDPSSPITMQRFNKALSSINCETSAVSRETLVALYLEALYPYQAIFELNSAKEVDALYLFSWLSVKEPWDLVDSIQTKRIRSPGIHNGAVLLGLPTQPSLRPRGLPSRFLAANDGHWFDGPSDSIHPATEAYLRKTLLITGCQLLQLDILVGSSGSSIDDVKILRMANLTSFFL